MIVIAADRPAATSSPTSACTLPGWVPVIGKKYFTLKAEFRTAQAVNPGPGPGGHDRRRQDRRNRQRRPARTAGAGEMNVTPKYAQLHLPQRDDAAAPQDAN